MTTWDRRPADVQRRVAAAALGRWLPLVLEAAPWWRDVGRALDLAPAEATTIEQLRRLPPTTTTSLRHAGPGGSDLVLRPTEDQFKTHGSAAAVRSVLDRLRRDGQPGRARALLEEFKPIHLHEADGLAVASSRTDLDRLHRAGARAAGVLGLTTDDYLLNAVPAGPTLAFWGLRHLALGASILAVHPRTSPDREALPALRRALDLLPATCVAVHDAEAVALAGALRGAPGLGAVRLVVLCDPPPGDERRGRIAEAWRRAGASADVAVRSLWAPPVARAPWAEAAGGGLVTSHDLDLLEVVDPVTGRTTEGAGDLAITSVGWHGTALVRVQTGVLVDGVATEGAGGRTVPVVLGQPRPRTWQVHVELRDGPADVDLRGAAAVLGAAPEVQAWRVEVPPRGELSHDRVLVEIAGDVAGPRAVELDAQLAAAMGAPPTQIVLRDEPARIDARSKQLGSPFADLRR